VSEFLVLYLDDRHKFTEGGKVNFNCLVGVDPDPPRRPNWYFVADSNEKVDDLDRLTVAPSLKPFELGDLDLIRVSFWERTQDSSVGAN